MSTFVRKMQAADVPQAAVPKATVSAAKAVKTTSVEGITEYRLANGMSVLLFPDNSKPTVTVNVTYMVGSRHEGAGETGMAHLLEHMLFKGTTSRPGGRLPHRMDASLDSRELPPFPPVQRHRVALQAMRSVMEQVSDSSP